MEGQVIHRRLGRLGLAALLIAGACGAPHPKAVVGQRTENFRVLYRVAHNENPAQRSVSWEVLTVKRPFTASDLTFAQRPKLVALGVPQTGTLTDIDHLYSIDGARMRIVGGRQPGLPTGDQALINVAADATERARARVTGKDTVLGRACTVVQFVEPPVGGLAPLRTKDDHDDMCITPGGVVLRESWTLKGRVVVTRDAVELTTAPDDAFDTSAAEDVAAGVPAAPRVAPIEEGLTPPPTPKGYTAATAVDFFLPRADAPTQLAYASKVWAFAKGGDEITVELGAGQVVPWSRDQEVALRVGGREAASIVRSDGIEIHWTSADHWIRVRGSVSLLSLFPYALLVSNWDSSPAEVPR